MNDLKFNSKAEEIDYIVANKEMLIATKKMSNKHTDAIHFTPTIEKNDASKAVYNGYDEPMFNNSDELIEEPTRLKARLVLNTTRIMDSHCDVHIDGLWNKTLKERRLLYLLQEHNMTFKGIISDNIKTSLELLDWSSVGIKAAGQTQALIFDVEIPEERNEFMFEQYKNGYVKNHSVGMRYVKVELAVNDERYPEEFKVWNKYIEQVVNRKDAEEKGYFYPVLEAKLLEGSAVPMGSNYATPVLSIEEKNIEPSVNDTQKNEPSIVDTQKPNSLFINLL